MGGGESWDMRLAQRVVSVSMTVVNLGLGVELAAGGVRREIVSMWDMDVWARRFVKKCEPYYEDVSPGRSSV
jgi:hypothetical protein